MNSQGNLVDIVDIISNSTTCCSSSSGLASKIYKDQTVTFFQDKSQCCAAQYLQGWCSRWRQNRRFQQKGCQHLNNCHALSFFYTLSRSKFYIVYVLAGGISITKSNWSLLKRSARNPVQLTITHWFYLHFKMRLKHIPTGFVTSDFGEFFNIESLCL